MRLGLLLLILAVWGSGIAVAMVSHETRTLYQQLGRLQQEQEQLATEWGRLTLEQGALAAPMRLDNYAREIGMQEPEDAQLRRLPEVSP